MSADSGVTNIPFVKIDDITSTKKYSCVGGPFGSSLSRKHYVEEEAVPVIRGTNLNGDQFIDDGFVFVSEEKGDKLHRNLAYPGDIVFTQRGTLGQVAIIPHDARFERYVVSQSQMKLTVNEEIADPYYVYSYFRSPEAKRVIDTNAIIGGVPHINLGILKAIKIPLPSLSAQKRIVGKIKSLDEKIELNCKTNQTLEQIAQAIFKSWFVDFEPVKAKIKAKQNGQDPELAAMCAISGKTEEQLKGLDKDTLQQLKTTAALFPDVLVESELGEIPEGWSVKSFSKLARLDTTSVKPNKEPEKLWEHYSIPAYDVDESPAYHLGLEIKSNKYKVDESSILVSKLNPHFPRTWWPDIEDTDAAICSTEFMQFIPHNTNHRAFVLGMVLSRPFQDGIMRRVTGSTGSRQRAQPPQVANMDVVMPKENLIDAYSNYLTSFSVTKAKNVKENLTLAKMRKTLLPKLLSGEITIGNTESTARRLG